jgi:arginine deiminase
MKLVDYARAQNWDVLFVGGSRDGMSEEKWAVERAMYELRWQGVNVAQLGPGRIIAYAHNVHTNEALRRAGVRVQTFPGEILAIRNGGPHCLIMPLVRQR